MDFLICHECKGMVLKEHMGKRCPYCKEWLYIHMSKESLLKLQKEGGV